MSENTENSQPANSGSRWAGWIASGAAFIASMWAGVYLCMNDFPVLGGWVCILSLLGTWGFEKVK